MTSFADKTVVIVGAAGGLGSAFARAFSDQGARVVLAGRNSAALQTLAAQLGERTVYLALDVTDSASLALFCDGITARYGRVDVVVNAAGYDVRKPLSQHSDTEIQRLLDVNLLGAILLTRTLMPMMLKQGAGTLVHIGGFADGRLAFPYYSVDVATRAGLRSFIESVNREIDNPNVFVSYFCPTSADTDAERPYHALWREMGVSIAPPEKVAAALLSSIQHKRRVTIMGVGARWLAGLNAIAPTWADALLLRRYNAILERHLNTSP